VTEVYFLTSNLGKLREASLIAEQYGISLRQLPAKRIEIQSDDLARISAFSARVAAWKHHVPVVVEDAGLFIKALGGFPGPYSSYVFKTIGVNGILKLMEGVRRREAYFLSVVAYCTPKGRPSIFKGRVDGCIASEARGTGGFGFDPIFIPKGDTRTFAEMSSREKNLYSHRAKAFTKFFSWLAERHGNL